MGDGRKPKFPIKELIKAGPAAPQVLVGHLVATQGPDIQDKVGKDRTEPDFDVEKYVDGVVKHHIRLAELQGAGGGAAIALAALPALAGGPAAVAAAAATAILGDLVALAWVQQRLVMHIAAAYGHDLGDKARIQEFLNLAGVDLMINSGGAATAGAGTRFGIKAATRWATSKSVEATRSMAQLVGARVAKRLFLKGIPVLNVPVGAVVSDVSTRRLAKRAREFYRTRPRTA